MSLLLEGKTALVTGASMGIGLAISKALAENGARVLMCARNLEKLDAAAARLRATVGDRFLTCAADVSQSAAVEKLFQVLDKEAGSLDILVNNAGVGIFRAAAELSIQEWDRVIGTNLSGAFYCTREALGRFSQHRGGRIINISSLAGKNPFAGGSAYNASKFGMNALSEATMLDHRFDNVRVSYIMPGSVATHFSPSGPEKGADWKIAPEDIAEIVLGILRMPERTLISRIEVRPSRPQKD
jgi:3-oxoacyl-[acyl-carrier protein] reductase